MQTRNPFLDQIGRLMTDAAGAAQGVREEMDTLIRRQAERLVADLDLVPREEFDMVKALAAAARADAEIAQARLEALEARLAQADAALAAEPDEPAPETAPARKRPRPRGWGPRRIHRGVGGARPHAPLARPPAA